MSFCRLTKGITPKICRLRVFVITNNRSFEYFMCLDQPHEVWTVRASHTSETAREFASVFAVCIDVYKNKNKKRYPPSEQKTQNLGEVIFPEFALTGGREMGVQILLCWIDLSLRRNLFSLVMQCKMASGLFRLRSNATENGPRRVSTARWCQAKWSAEN